MENFAKLISDLLYVHRFLVDGTARLVLTHRRDDRSLEPALADAASRYLDDSSVLGQEIERLRGRVPQANLDLRCERVAPAVKSAIDIFENQIGEGRAQTLLKLEPHLVRKSLQRLIDLCKGNKELEDEYKSYPQRLIAIKEQIENAGNRFRL